MYYQRQLKNDQLLIFNAVGTYIDSKYTRLYAENQDNNEITNILSNITGDKYSLITEGIYERKLFTGTLSSGVKHTQSLTKNEYAGNVAANVAMNTAETYLFTEFQLKKNKFNYAFGVGIMRTYNSQGGESNEKYIFRPTIRATYNINDNLFLRYRFDSYGNPPSLSDLNNVAQEIDSLQIQKGNPNLKTVTAYANTLTGGFNKGIFSTDLYAKHSYDHKPIMEEVYYEDGKFVRTNRNQKGFHRITVAIHLKFKLWGDHLVLATGPEYRRFISKGNNYTHTYTNWSLYTRLSFNYKRLTAEAQFNLRYNNLWGETLSRNERGHTLSVGYNAPKWSVGLWAFNLFSSNYFQDSRNLSALTPKYSKVYSRDLGGGRMLALSASFNVNFGRQFRSAHKRLNNDDSDAGIMK